MRAELWHPNFIQSLKEASDLDGQRAAWVDRTNTPFPDPVELLCQLFDDSAIDDLMAKGVVFSETTDAALRRLSTLAAITAGMDLHQTPERLLSSEPSIEFTREAARALALVKADLGL